MSKKKKSDAQVAPKSYCALILTHDRDFPLSNSGLFEREPDFETASGRKYPKFSFQAEPLGPKAAYFFFLVDQDNGDFRRSLTNAYLDLRPDVAFSVGYGLADRAIDSILLKVPSRVLNASPQKSPVTKLAHVHVSPLYDRDCRWEKLASHISNPLWLKDYRARSSSNIEPDGKGCVAMVHCAQTESYISQLRTKYKEVDLFDRSRVLMETYTDYSDHEAWVLRAPFSSIDEPSQPETSEHGRRRSIDLIYSYVTSYVEHERRIALKQASADSTDKNSKGSAKSAKIVFGTDAPDDADQDQLKKIAAGEAKDIWKTVRNFFITGALGGAVRFFFGSTGIEVELDNRDRAILNVLCRSRILETAVGKRQLLSYDSSYDISELSTRFVSFLADVESLQNLSHREKKLSRFARKWETDPLVGKVASALAGNEGLRDEEEFESCG